MPNNNLKEPDSLLTFNFSLDGFKCLHLLRRSIFEFNGIIYIKDDYVIFDLDGLPLLEFTIYISDTFYIIEDVYRSGKCKGIKYNEIKRCLVLFMKIISNLIEFKKPFQLCTCFGKYADVFDGFYLSHYASSKRVRVIKKDIYKCSFKPKHSPILQSIYNEYIDDIDKADEVKAKTGQDFTFYPFPHNTFYLAGASVDSNLAVAYVCFYLDMVLANYIEDDDSLTFIFDRCNYKLSTLLFASTGVLYNVSYI